MKSRNAWNVFLVVVSVGLALPTSSAMAWRGWIENVRVYWGELDAEKIEAWAGK